MKLVLCGIAVMQIVMAIHPDTKVRRGSMENLGLQLRRHSA
ncbi:MAG: hypothetical protein ACRD3R_15295 [Terriglobales bacterium]